MIPINKTLLALALGAAVAAPAFAQESLLDVYQLALQNDPAIRDSMRASLPMSWPPRCS